LGELDGGGGEWGGQQDQGAREVGGAHGSGGLDLQCKVVIAPCGDGDDS
jgi:hypothetical protein